MEIFHVLMGGAEHRALRFFDDKELNLLIAASMLNFETRWKKHLNLIQSKAKLLFADSGLLGWIKKYGTSAIEEYAENPQKVLDIQMQIDPDVIAHVDIPCEDSILEMAKLDRISAINQTIQNAEFLIEESMKNQELKDKKIAIVVQGFHLSEYEYCLNEYEKRGFFNLPSENYWFAIGSVCMRKPPDLYKTTKFVREAIPQYYHVHCFGIANPKWVLEMKKYGINSVDSATASFAAAMFQIIDYEGKRKRLKLPSKDKYMFAALTAFNMASLQKQVKDDVCGDPQCELFEEICCIK